MKRSLAALTIVSTLALSACTADVAENVDAVPRETPSSSPAPSSSAPSPTVIPGAQVRAVETPRLLPPRVIAPPATLRKLPVTKPPKPATTSLLPGPWGVYKGPMDQLWPAYERARGEERALLGEIALLPRASKWFGVGFNTSTIESGLREYIANSQAGNTNALVQITVFRMSPWYTASKSRAPSPAEANEYRAWIDASARAIGNTRTALYLQPDSTFLRTVPDYALSTSLIRYAAQKYGNLPNTRVYLETGGYDWPAPGQGGAVEAARLLQDSGIEYADGVVTNTTHYNGVENDIRRVAELVEIFNSRGITGLKGVINTSTAGNGFDFGTYTGPDPDNAFVCESRPYRGTCAALGIPPTWDVTNPRWGLDAETNALAKKYIDAYAWVGRPWLYRQADPFQLSRAIPLVQNWEYR